MRESQPAGLLDDHIRAIGPRLRAALTVTASRNRSLGARSLLARAALGDHGTLDELLAAARAGDRRWLKRIRRRVRPAMLAAVAQAIALQELRPTDRGDALALFELVRRVYGSRVVPSSHQTLHTQLALVLAGPQRAAELLDEYRRIAPAVRAGVATDLLNPFLADRPMAPWLARFQAQLPAPAPFITDGPGSPFDRVTAPPAERVDSPHRISVVVTAFRPDQGLLTAVRSILAQSWSNVEVIVVDDASPPEYDPILQEAAALGERIRLVKMPINSGTYAARNAGLDAAGGEFAAFQDSDDWSHPLRLETQVRPLLEDRRLVATTSEGLAVTDDLQLTRLGVRSSRLNPSSLLFRRTRVMRKVGYFDRVRKAADSEFIGRIQAAFGIGSVRHLESLPLALIRLSSGSLSRAEIKPHWMHPARVAYMSAYQRRHHLIATGAVPALATERPFPAPRHLLGADPAEVLEYDVVVLADWRFLETAQRSAVEELRALAEAGLRVAILQLESYRAVSLRRLPLCGPIQDLVNAGVVERAGLYERIETALLIVRQPAVMQFTEGVESQVRARRTVVVADRAPIRSDGSDRRYVPATCGAAVRRMFGAEPLWMPQDAGVRAALRGAVPAVPLTDEDLPVAIAERGWVADRTGASPGRVVVGTDLCDAAAQPSDIEVSLAVCRRLPAADARIRLPDRPAGELAVRLPREWLGFEVADLTPREFGHQLDFYLHFPPREAAEWYSRPALEAAAAGCVVVMPERYAGLYGDAAVYCGRSEVAALIARYRADPALFAEQSRRARAVVAGGYDPALLVERIMALLPVTAAATTALPIV
ncbi:MAG: glycosyltransferase family A protein [Actinoplanes sp.]